ncbi:hypothetical protein L1887_01855 [Cichorium endivia]|nr:hypothetical protein L1887_01855 [Cichorium endivia]
MLQPKPNLANNNCSAKVAKSKSSRGHRIKFGLDYCTHFAPPQRNRTKNTYQNSSPVSKTLTSDPDLCVSI